MVMACAPATPLKASRHQGASTSKQKCVIKTRRNLGMGGRMGRDGQCTDHGLPPMAGRTWHYANSSSNSPQRSNRRFELEPWAYEPGDFSGDLQVRAEDCDAGWGGADGKGGAAAGRICTRVGVWDGAAGSAAGLIAASCWRRAAASRSTGIPPGTMTGAL